MMGNVGKDTLVGCVEALDLYACWAGQEII